MLRPSFSLARLLGLSALWLGLLVGCGGGGPVSFVAAPAVKLVFLTTSLSATAGEAVAPEVEVAIQDELGHTVASASNEVSLLLAAGPASAGLEGTLTARAVNGVASFPRVVLRQAGTGYKLKATSTGLADATSATFAVVPAPPTEFVLSSLPGPFEAGEEFSVEVQARDAFGNDATGYVGSVTPDLSYAQPMPSTGGNIRIGQAAMGAGIVDASMVDNLGWGSALAPEGDAAPVAGAGGSLERKAALQSTAETMEGGADAVHGNGIDSDWNADDFVIRMVRGPQNSASSPETP